MIFGLTGVANMATGDLTDPIVGQAQTAAIAAATPPPATSSMTPVLLLVAVGAAYWYWNSRKGKRAAGEMPTFGV